ncbi:Phage head-tail joining protein [Aquimixticola soesokkakensis]|uniref:Phage head-tail joining protein n=1 Tax=Aquimixticola soesokkakensis TaxID=1519096 RepID=A0A1Y5SQC6_9RHOB|nr:head-tail adaptor protein [Aquimixticola soesokkakensis]SLN45992.1 Phage head-tail joining protein [Aquimixticola soesokkakensis]
MGDVHLNRKLVLEEAARVSDGAGGYVETWVEVGVLWAQITAAGAGAQASVDFLTISSVPYRVVVRSAPQGSPRRPKPAQRFREGGRVFSIIAVSETDTLGRYLTCHSREEVAA